jgi:hypothetical protein
MAMAHTNKNNKTNIFRLQMTALCKEVDAVDVGNRQNNMRSRKRSELTKIREEHIILTSNETHLSPYCKTLHLK